jgi:HEAT repeat protein
MGLVASGYPRALVELTALLNDSDAAARMGAVRAIACGNPREAELLLRSKALAGDAEPQVLGECFTGLLGVEPDESLKFVAGYLTHADEAVRELAALALGESRLDAALAPLKEAWAACSSARSFAEHCCAPPRRIAARPRSTGCSKSSATLACPLQ